MWIWISLGGVTSTGTFLNKFFPVVYRKYMMITGENSNNYCKQDDKGLRLFVSSSYLAGLTSTFFASYTTRKFGRKFTMSIAGVFFIVGVILSTTGQNLAMIIVGRILFGFGIGFANQVHLYIYNSWKFLNFWLKFMIFQKLQCNKCFVFRQFLYICRRSHQLENVEHWTFYSNSMSPLAFSLATLLIMEHQSKL